MNKNLFSSLFRYKPCNKRPLEDFITESLAFLLDNDHCLLKLILSRFLCRKLGELENVSIKTQYVLDVGRIDMAIFWREYGDKYSLFIENKVWSEPWESSVIDDDDEKKPCETNQISTYCKYQVARGRGNYVVLISNSTSEKYSLPNFLGSSDVYLGNFFWRDIDNILYKHAIKCGENTFSYVYVNELSEFFRRQNMSGFRNFDVCELSSVSVYSSYKYKFKNLTCSIHNHFINLELTNKCLIKSKYSDEVLGVVIFHNGGKDTSKSAVDDASLWFMLGVCLLDNDWFIKPIVSGVPDVMCCVALWFKDANDRENFIDENNIQISINETIQVTKDTLKDNALVFHTRKSLLCFMGEDDQENAILEFLKDAATEIKNCTTINDMIDIYIKTMV